jgi:hypothetical protein
MSTNEKCKLHAGVLAGREPHGQTSRGHIVLVT